MKPDFGIAKPVIGMVHFPATPGTPRFDGSRTVTQVIEGLQRDVDHLLDNGVDALLFCNEDDRPYSFNLGPATVAFMTRAITEVDRRDVLFGVDVLWDPFAALSIAAATGASFIREVMTGTYESDMGVWSTDPERLWNFRRSIAATDVAMWANIQPEFASPLGNRTIAQRAKSALASSLPDALLVSGPMAGAAPDPKLLEETRAAIPADVTLVVNTGARPETIAAFLQHADAVIVGSSLKVDGDTWNPVDPERVKRFMDAVAKVR
jgi:membrane complex biogenesis BtpA family protein